MPGRMNGHQFHRAKLKMVAFIVVVGSQGIAEACVLPHVIPPQAGQVLRLSEPFRHLVYPARVVKALARNQQRKAREEPVAGDVVRVGMGVDYQLGRVLFLEPLETVNTATSINEDGDFAEDENGVGEWELSALLPLEQKDVGGDFG